MISPPPGDPGEGETVVIAKAGQPIAKLTPIDAPEAGRVRRLGFLADATVASYPAPVMLV